MQKRGKNICNLIKATRINRTLPSISLILFACSLMNAINKEIYSLMGICFLLYAPGGILNAIKDKDYSLPKYSKILVFLLPAIAIIISLSNNLLLIATISWIIFGFIYNVLSRKILLLDTTAICLTHHFIPVFFSLLILGAKLELAINSSLYVYSVFWFLAPIKNLNGIEKDRELKYQTLPANYRHGKIITIILYYISFLVMTLAYFLFELNSLYTIFLGLLLLLFLVSKKTFSMKDKSSMLGIVRLIICLFAFSLTISTSNNLEIILPSFAIILFFIFAFIKDFSKSK